MDPYSGMAYELREELLEPATVGEQVNLEELRLKVAALEDATGDEIAATEARALVRVSEEAAQRLILGKKWSRFRGRAREVDAGYPRSVGRERRPPTLWRRMLGAAAAARRR